MLEKRQIDSLTEEEGWRRRLVNGTQDGRIPGGESMQELSDRVHAARWRLSAGATAGRPTLYWSVTVSRWAVWSGTILGLPHGRNAGLRLRNCSISRIGAVAGVWVSR
ncbi:histidine phosphatase family protein [Salmonella enterica subsp. enterica]|nr:histidine phosphatase family protein [Salmonella enterica subsp. enterica]